MGYHTCFVRLMHKQTSLQLATFEARVFCEKSSQKFCEVTACRSHTVHRPCSLQIHPSRSCPFVGRANISQDESACMKAHTRSPVSTRRSNHAAYSNSPRTDNGEGVGANTSSLPVVAKSFNTHLDLTSLPFNRRAQTFEQNRFVGRYVSLLDPRVQLQIFHLLDFSFISGLDFVGGQSIDQGTFIYCSNRQVCVRPSFLVDIKFQTILHELKKRFLPLVPSSARFHHRLVPVDEMSLVLFESYLHPFCRCDVCDCSQDDGRKTVFEQGVQRITSKETAQT